MNTELYYNPDDTICAISTPAGTGGVAIARVSGREAFDTVARIWHGKNIATMPSHTAHLGTIVNPDDGSTLDQVVLTVFRAPHSFTGDNVAEISMHGSRWIQRRMINALITAGARLALPGEFTRRAFASGKMDLAEAEAVADLIASSAAAAHHQALNQMRGKFSQHINNIRARLVELASLLELELDFSEEEVEFASRDKLRALADESARALQNLSDSFAAGKAIKDGIPVAIIGKTNVGKSSLLNALLGDDRAIVSNIHGTTRDIVEDTAEAGPYLLRFKDTAGIRHSDDPVENMGIERSRRAATSADLVLLVLDATESSTAPDIEGISPERLIVVTNKSDLAAPASVAIPCAASVAVSALTSQGLEDLRREIVRVLDTLMNVGTENDILVTNARHAQAFAAAAQSLRAVLSGLDTGLPADLIAQDLREAIHHLSTVTGAITTPEILSTIFTHFCIGK